MWSALETSVSASKSALFNSITRFLSQILRRIDQLDEIKHIDAIYVIWTTQIKPIRLSDPIFRQARWTQ